MIVFFAPFCTARGLPGRRHLVDSGGLAWFQDHACEAPDRAALERKSMHAHIHTYTYHEHIYQYVLDTNSGGCDDIRVRPHLFDGSTHCMWTPV